MTIGVFWSGGLDSSIAAVKASRKDKIELLFVDNGVLIGGWNWLIERAKEIKKLTRQNELKLVVLNGIPLFKKYVIEWVIKDLVGRKVGSWAICLTCKMIMYSLGIAYALKNDIKVLVDGNSSRQRDYPEQHEKVIEFIKEFVGKYGIKLESPVYGIKSKQEAQIEALKYQLLPKAIEPLCMFANSFEFNKSDISKVVDFMLELEPRMKSEIEDMLKGKWFIKEEILI